MHLCLWWQRSQILRKMPRTPEMDWKSENLSESLGIFKEQIAIYCEDENIPSSKQHLKILRGIGDEGIRRLQSSGLSDTEKKNTDKLWDFFRSQVSHDINFRVHRLTLMNLRQKEHESLDEFIARARTVGHKCQFEKNDLDERLLELIIASTPIEEYQRLLLSKNEKYKLKEALAEGRRFEAILAGRKEIEDMKKEQTKCRSSKEKDKQNDKEPEKENIDAQQFQPKANKCRFCGLNHAAGTRQCPAYGQKCLACGKLNHWSKVCRSRNSDDNRNQQQQGKRSNNVHDIEHDVDDDDDAHLFDCIQIASQTIRKEVFTDLFVLLPGKENMKDKIRLKIDTGAAGNTLPLRTIKQMYGHDYNQMITPDRSVRLTAYNGQDIKCLGTITLQIRHTQDTYTPAKFYVVDVPGPAIIGLPSCERLQLVTINCAIKQAENVDLTSTEGLMKSYPEQFDQLGNFKKPAAIHVKPNAEPHIDAPRKCPIHVKDKLKSELDKMEAKGVIRKVSEHTDWCSSLAFSTKKDGSLRICIDPKKLNDALKRCPHKIPTLEELNTQFSGSTVFSKLDAKAGYWSVHLEPDSQLLTTFRTPFGRYCWTRLPFGLNVSQDIFQARMDEILEGLEGVVGIHDDVCVHGKTNEEHDRNLKALMDRAAESGLVFNSEKCDIRKPEISFFGNIYSASGIRPDPEKVKAIKNMPAPESKEDMQRFLGIMTYMANFMPNFSNRSQALRDLLKKDTPFVMDQDHIHCFEELKKGLSDESCLAFYDPSKPVTLEVDSSQRGMGAALVQENQPVAFASKSLSETQSNYPNIDREMLAVVFGISRFQTYLYGRRFTVITDHRPLVMIVNKPLHRAPPRLQRMLYKIQGYDFDLQYRPGSTMTLSDTLSRLPDPTDNDSIPLDLRVDGIDLTAEEIEQEKIGLVWFTHNMKKQLQDETDRDLQMRLLKQRIVQGWPENIKDLEPENRNFWSYREELGIENGIIFKGPQVLIPKSLQKGILQQLHRGHQGVEKTRLLARESVYWQNINTDIEKMIQECDACQETRPANNKEPLIPHEIPQAPWKKLGTDIFEINGKHYLLIADYMTKYPIVVPVTTISSENIAEQTKRILGMFGKPDIIISDNATTYTGKAYQDFISEWSINHITSSPKYPKSNGFIERQVQTVKNLIKKCQRKGDDIQLALLSLRATPIDHNLPSPAEMLMNRKLATILPHHSEAAPQYQREALEKRQKQMKENHDKTAGKELPQLQKDQLVHVRDNQTKTWKKGTVVKVCKEPRSYQILRDDGATLRRNRRDVRPRATTQPPDNTHDRQHLQERRYNPSYTQDSGHRRCNESVPSSSTYPAPTPQGRQSCNLSRPVRSTQSPRYLKDFVCSPKTKKR